MSTADNNNKTELEQQSTTSNVTSSPSSSSLNDEPDKELNLQAENEFKKRQYNC